MLCYLCKKPGATVADPCCGAPDCENFMDMAHIECLSPEKQRLEREWEELEWRDWEEEDY